MLQNKHFNTIYITGIFLILLLPLLSLPPLFHPPSWAKEIVFRMIFSVLIFIFLYQSLLYNKENLLKLKEALFNRKSGVFVLLWLLAIMLALLFLSVIFSVDPFFSFWGSPIRGGGALNFLFVSLFSVFTFLVLKEKNWQWFWNMNIIIGFVASLVGIMQKFALFEGFIMSHSDRPPSSFGGPIFFALYLVLLIFFCISFAMASTGFRRALYISCSVLFLFCIILSGTRAALLGFAMGIAYFILFFPYRSPKVKWAKIIFLALIIFGVLSVFLLKSQPGIISAISGNRYFGPNFARTWNMVGNFSIKDLYTSRLSGWSLAVKAVKEKPLLGWGPGNFSVPFDKYYDPNLPGLSREISVIYNHDSSTTTWWDKAHSFFFEYASCMGVPFLLVYLLFNGVLFFQLGKLKNTFAHGMQATIIGYLLANLFSFDVFSTYLLYFLVVGCSLYLIYKAKAVGLENKKPTNHNIFAKPSFAKKSLIFVMFFVLVWFLWPYNIKLLQINKDINTVAFLVERGNCEQALAKADKLLSQKSVLDNHLHLNYIDAAGGCIEKNPKNKNDLLYYKVLGVIGESIKERPIYTRNWLFQGFYAYYILSGKTDIEGLEKDRLINLAYSSFDKTAQLSPARQITILGRMRTDLALNRYEEAKKDVEKCIAVDPNFIDCWWMKSLIYLNSGDVQEGTNALNYALDRGYFHNAESEKTINQLISGYALLTKNTGTKKYQPILVRLYKELVFINPKNFQNHASLAFLYKEMGEYDKARQESLKVLELSPESRESVEAFLKTLPK